MSFACETLALPPRIATLTRSAGGNEGLHHQLKSRHSGSDVIQPLSANWKTVTEAFVEVYHVSGIHPQFLAASDDFNVAIQILSERFGHSRVIIPFGIPSPKLSTCTEADIVREYVHTGGVVRGADISLDGVAFDWDLETGKDTKPVDGRTRHRNARDFLIDFVGKALAARECQRWSESA